MNSLHNYISHTYAITERAAIDLTLSENPLGLSHRVAEAIIHAVQNAHLYPCEEKALIRLIASHHHIAEDTILLGAGANQLLEEYLKVLALKKKIVVPSATFPESVSCMETLQGSVERIPLQSDFGLNLDAMLKAVTVDTGVIHLNNPNNPTGIWTDTNRLLDLAAHSPVPLLISEAGADFVGQTIIHPTIPSNIIVVRSFSKAYGLAGLRIGYSVASPEMIATMKRKLRSYRVSSLAIAAASAAIMDQDHLHTSVAYILQEKTWLMNEMSALGFEIVPSQGQNFIAKVPKEYSSADHFCNIAKQYGIAVVNCSLYAGLQKFIRISPQKREINQEFISILKKIQEETL